MKKLLLLSILSFFIPSCIAYEVPYEKPIVFTTGVKYEYDANWKNKANTECYYIPIMNVVEDADYEFVEFVTYRFSKKVEIIKKTNAHCIYKNWDLCYLD